MPDWKRPILFEEIALPGCAIAIDHLGLYGNLPEMSEATSEWLWRFTICVGRVRSDSSPVIIQHAGETIDLIERFRERLLVSVPKRYDSTFAPEVISDWHEALSLMVRIALTRPACSWTAPSRPGDKNYGREWADVRAELEANVDNAIARAKADASPE